MNLSPQQLADTLKEFTEQTDAAKGKLKLSPDMQVHMEIGLDSIYQKVSQNKPVYMSDLQFMEDIFTVAYLPPKLQPLINSPADLDQVIAENEQEFLNQIPHACWPSADISDIQFKALQRVQPPAHLDNLPQKYKDQITGWRTYISDNSKQISYPYLQEVGTFYSLSVNTIDLPKVKSAKELDIAGTRVVALPSLTKVTKKLSIREADFVKLPELESAQEMRAPGVQNLEIPQLKQAKDIFADKVTGFKAPELVTVEKRIVANNAVIVELDKLQSAQGLSFKKAKEIYVNSLKSVIDNFDARQAEYIYAPELESVGSMLKTPKIGGEFITPKLK